MQRTVQLPGMAGQRLASVPGLSAPFDLAFQPPSWFSLTSYITPGTIADPFIIPLGHSLLWIQVNGGGAGGAGGWPGGGAAGGGGGASSQIELIRRIPAFGGDRRLFLTVGAAGTGGANNTNGVSGGQSSVSGSFIPNGIMFSNGGSAGVSSGSSPGARGTTSGVVIIPDGIMYEWLASAGSGNIGIGAGARVNGGSGSNVGFGSGGGGSGGGGPFMPGGYDYTGAPAAQPMTLTAGGNLIPSTTGTSTAGSGTGAAGGVGGGSGGGGANGSAGGNGGVGAIGIFTSI